MATLPLTPSAVAVHVVGKRSSGNVAFSSGMAPRRDVAPVAAGAIVAAVTAAMMKSMELKPPAVNI